MKITVILLFLFTTGLFASEALSQIAKVSISSSEASYREILNDIENQTEYLFVYDKSDIDLDRKTEVEAQDKPVAEVLSNMFQHTDIIYAMEGNNIMLMKTDAKPSFPMASVAQQNTKRITGVVMDTNGDPIIGANVVVKGTTNGNITDIDGKFTLEVNEQNTLHVSYIGYISKEIHVGNQSNFIIELREDTQALEEVVVIGYGVVKKSDLTGAVASVNSKNFKDQPITRVEDALQGRMAGVEVTNTSGIPGADVKIRVRGTTSVNKGNDPLYVVDGIVRTTGLNGINTSDIQSIEVLKDASSTAIYGSRGANGVVIITTKRGQEGKARITFESELGFSTMAKKYDLLNAYEYAQALNDVKGTGTISDADMQDYRDGIKGIDWQDVMTHTGVVQNYKLSVSGGNKDTKYFISGNVLDQSAITVTTKYQRYQFRANVDTKVTSWFNIMADMNVAKTHNHNQNVDLWAALTYSPTMEMIDPKTNRYNKDEYNNATSENPYGALKVRDRDNYNYVLNGNLDLQFKITEGLNLSIQGGINYNDNPSYFFSSSRRSPSAESQMNNENGRTFFWQNVNNLTYQKRFGDHHLTATGVWEMSKAEYSSMSISGSDLLTESVGYWNVNIANSRNQDNYYSAESMVSGVGRVAYNYKGRYFATATFRADASSKFQKGNRWGYFPSGAVAWNIAEEEFMETIDLFQQLKVRASAGIIGNQGIGRYETLGSLSATSYSYGTEGRYTGYWAQNLASPHLSWEKTYQYDIGLDVSLFDQQLNLSFDWFLKQSKDLLFQKQIPGYNGGVISWTSLINGTNWVNQGEIKNTGIEISINAIPIKNRNFTWESTFNTTYLKNEVIDLAGDPFLLPATFASGIINNPTILEPGKPIGSFYLYEWAGFNENGANLYYDVNGEKVTDPSAEDKVIKGNANPKWVFGWNNMISWKNWEASLFFNAAVGFQKLNATRFSISSMVGDVLFITSRDAYFKGWDKVENKADARYPSLTTDNKNYGDSDMWLENSSYLKLRNMSIAYNIPRSVTKFADIKVSFSCQNLFTITGYTGMDPEVITNRGGGVDVANGVDFGAYPIPRTYTFGLKLDF